MELGRPLKITAASWSIPRSLTLGARGHGAGNWEFDWVLGLGPGIWELALGVGDGARSDEARSSWASWGALSMSRHGACSEDLSA